MLTDKAYEASNDGEVMSDKISSCKFCNQFLNIRVPDTWDEEMCREMATEKCKCKKSMLYTTRKDKIEKLDNAIEQYFGTGSGRKVESREIDIIRNLGISVIDGKLNKINMELPSSDDAPEKIKMSAKDSILKIVIEKKKKDEASI